MLLMSLFFVCFSEVRPASHHLSPMCVFFLFFFLLESPALNFDRGETRQFCIGEDIDGQNHSLFSVF